jgi:hypothetical protein
VQLYLSLTLTLDGVGCQHPAPAALPPEKRYGTHCTGDWVGPRAGLDGCETSRTPPPRPPWGRGRDLVYLMKH